MPSFSSMHESKYLKKEDFPRPALLTIVRFDKQNVAQQNEPPEYKWIAYFAEKQKGMVMNPTNLQLMQMATAVTSSEAAVGKKVVVFADPTVSMAGKLVGGLRIRAPKNQPSAQTLPEEPIAHFPEEEPELPQEGEDDVPF